MKHSAAKLPARAFGILMSAVLTGCAGMSEQACLSSDWRGIGFEDGVYGRAVGQIGNYRQACSKYGIAPDLDAYRAGHAEGVEVYCRPANGFDAGRRGASYQGVCPSGLEADFLTAYNTGRRLYELESAVRSIDNRIANNVRAQEGIKKQLTEIAATIALSETAPDERVRLVAEAADLGSHYAELEAETKTLRDDRVVAALELEQYQESLNGEYQANAR
jgi:Protein of unknown function (DUF2799)